MNLANYTGWTLDYITKGISVKAMMLLIESLPDREERDGSWHRSGANAGPATETDFLASGLDSVIQYEKKAK